MNVFFKKWTASQLVAWSMLLLVMSLAGCEQKPRVDPKQAEIARTALVEWLECEECTENQLENMLRYQQQLQPLLISTLQQGPAPASRALYRHQLQQRYDRLVEYSRSHPEAKPSLPKDKFVELYLDNFDAQYRTRAAQALGEMGGEDSRKALQEALKYSLRDDVRKVVEDSLDAMNR